MHDGDGIRRRPDGTIDMDFYHAKLARLRPAYVAEALVLSGAVFGEGHPAEATPAAECAAALKNF